MKIQNGFCILGISCTALLLLACSNKPKPSIEIPAPEMQSAPPPSAYSDTRTASNSRGEILEKARDIFRPIYFGLDASDLSNSARVTLDGISAFMKQYPSIAVTIQGHCDERGTPEYNLALGEKRARVVFEYLKNLSFRNFQARIVSYGEESPAQEGHDEATWKLNRRVEFKVDLD